MIATLRSFKLLLVLLLAPLGTGAGTAQEVRDSLAKVQFLIHQKNWENASKVLANLEKTGGCKPAVCLATHALISDGTGAGAEALDYARQALAAGQDSGLNAAQSNDLGVVLCRRAEGKRELLQLAEKTLRHADSIYKGGASNIRFNLAKVLQKLGQTGQAKEIMKKLDAEGILIDPGMAILGDFKGTGAPINRVLPKMNL
jgi:tetratricopeptide (TPR) repeat protein